MFMQDFLLNSLYVKGENGVKPSGDELKIYADAILQKINSLGTEQ